MIRTLAAALAASFAIAAAAAAENLLVNPDFDLSPVTSGWSAVGTGSVTHLVGFGHPAPSAQLDAEGSELIALQQCRPVSGDTLYDVEARTYTSFASGLSTNAVRIRWYALEGCSDEIESAELIDTIYTPGGFALRHLRGVSSPADAQSARVDLEVVANGTPTQVFFDAVYLPEADGAAAALAACGALWRRRRVR
jgi:hypothetical protein